jgi:hypothetical protein
VNHKVLVYPWQNMHHCHLFQNINDQSLRRKEKYVKEIGSDLNNE